jgi:hypothetical protein
VNVHTVKLAMNSSPISRSFGSFEPVLEHLPTVWAHSFRQPLSHSLAQDYEKPWIVSKRRGAEQVVLFGTEKYQPEMEHADSRLEGSTESV